MSLNYLRLCGFGSCVFLQLQFVKFFCVIDGKSLKYVNA